MADYFVKNGGDDAKDGLSDPNAWAYSPSMASASGVSDATTLGAGDSVSFNRGDTWREELGPRSGSDGSPLAFGAYGTGDDPIITGAALLVSWADQTGNIWMNDELSANPNTVWLDATTYPEAADAASVDATNRWFYHEGDDELFVYATEDPSTFYSVSGVESPAFSFACVLFNDNWVTLDDLHFKYARSTVLAVQGNSSNNVVTNCTAGGAGIFTTVGVVGTGSNNLFNLCTFSSDDITRSNDTVRFERQAADIPTLNTMSNCTIAAGSHSGMKLQDVTDHIIEHCTFTSSAGYGRNVEILGRIGSGNNIFRYNLVQDGQNGAFAEQGKNQFSGDSNQIYYNIFANEAKISIAVTDFQEGGSGTQYFAVNCVFYNNVIYNCTEQGILVGLDNVGSTGNVFKNNIVMNCDDTNDYQIEVRAGDFLDAATFTNNCLFKSGVTDILFYDSAARTLAFVETTYPTFFSDNITADPLFNDAANNDLHLTSPSPCIDAGVDVGLIRDFDGNPIIISPIGAYDYHNRYRRKYDFGGTRQRR